MRVLSVYQVPRNCLIQTESIFQALCLRTMTVKPSPALPFPSFTKWTEPKLSIWLGEPVP